MRNIILAVLLVLTAPLTSRADLKLILKIAPESPIQFETVYAGVTVLNDNNEALMLDEIDRYNKAHVSFIIERKRDEPIKKNDTKPLVSKLRVGPGEKHDFVVDLSSAYDLGAPGRYVIKAVLVDDKVTYESNPVVLDIVRGIEVASISKEVPGDSKRMRKYTLRYWSRNKNETLFLSVDEDEGKTNYGVFPLGFVIRNIKPVLTVDRDGRVIVIHQATRDYFLRSEFESEKDVITFVNQSRIDSEGKPYVPSAEKTEKSSDSGRSAVPRK